MKRIFRKQELLDMDLPYAAIQDNIIDNTGLSIYHEIVFEYDIRRTILQAQQSIKMKVLGNMMMRLSVLKLKKKKFWLNNGLRSLEKI